MTRRFRQTMKGSFFGDFIYYIQVIPEDHFLMQLDRTIDWRPFTAELVKSYKGLAECGEVPFDPVMILKMPNAGSQRRAAFCPSAGVIC